MKTREELLERIDSLATGCSEENWDSYGGRPLTEDAINAMKVLVQVVTSTGPHIFPTVDGGLSMEFWGDSTGIGEIEIELGPDGKIVNVFRWIDKDHWESLIPDPEEQAPVA